MSATKTLFITLSRCSPDEPWGFTMSEGTHRRLDNSIFVQTVQSNSPAYEAGLLPGDLVLGIDNSPITGRPLTYPVALDLIHRARLSIELQVLREPFNRVKHKTMYKTSPEPYSRPSSAASGVGKIPAIAVQDSGVRLPDNNIIQFHNEKAREQWAITKQTYRTTPIIAPKPKVRRDWPMGCYLQHMEGPGWHELPRTVQCADPNKLKVLNQYTTPSDPNDKSGLVHLQYNSPINLYSAENVQGSLAPGQRGTSPAGIPSSNASSSVSPQPPQFNARNLNPNHQPPQNPYGRPVTVDITNSPTYQFLQDEQQNNRGKSQSHSPKYSPVTGHHSPQNPQQTPYMKTLMHSLHVSDY